MEAKLIKDNNNYYLKNNDRLIGTTDWHLLSSMNVMELPLKNCQEIELGYDLDELAKEKYPYEKTEMFSCFELDCKQEGFIEGAKTILEILGDKKFSEDDVKRAIFNFANYDYKNISELDGRDKAIQSLQQTEWDVWLVMACGLPDGCTEPKVTCTCDIIPSLDTDGCLILKRI